MDDTFVIFNGNNRQMCIRDSLYTDATIINDVVYRIKQEEQQEFKVVRLDRLANYYFRDRLKVRDEQA